MTGRRWLLCVLTLILSAPSVYGQAPLVDAALMQRAQVEGTVRVIVELGGLNIRPEAILGDDAAVGAQRQAIATAQGTLRHALRGLRHRVVRQLRTVPLLAIEASPDTLRMLESMRGVVVRVHEDRLNAPLLVQSAPLVGALATANAGLEGTGTVVAILDTGVDKAHPFLAGRVIEEACFSSIVEEHIASTCPNGLEQQLGPGSGVPCPIGCEHGSHVAGIAAGSGGVARGAKLAAVQVFAQGTTALACGSDPPPCVRASDSDVLAGLEHVYSLRETHNLAAVNLSLGSSPSLTPCDGSPYKPLIDLLRSAGIATVVASGNDVLVNAISEPACVSTAVSVGATTKTDAVAFFSNVASFLSLFAPGQSIASSIPGGGFGIMNGTSQAAPHAAGAFAILKQAVPGATVTQILQALQETGRPITDVTGITRPRIQVDAALGVFGIGPLPPFTFISSNATNFSGGQTIALALTAANPAGNAPLDLYVGALFPDGNTIAFLEAPNAIGGLGQLSTPGAGAAFATAGAGYAVSGLPVLSFTFPASGIPSGTYRAFAALFRQGALADNAWNDGDLVGLHVVEVAYSP